MGPSEYIAIIGVLVAVITLIVTIRIARIIPERDKLSHRKHIREVVLRLSDEMKTGRNHMCKIIDIDRFETLYPDNFNSRNRQSYFKAELDGTDIHGVAFTNGILGVIEGKDSIYRVTKENNNTHKVARSGLIPYDWIIDIDESGDEIDTGAIFYCKFKKRKICYGRYYVSGHDGSLIDKRGLYCARSPFRSFAYYLITDEQVSYRHYVNVKRNRKALNLEPTKTNAALRKIIIPATQQVNLSDFNTFDPLTDAGKSIPALPGNYLVTIRDIEALPALGYKLVTQQFRSQELIYTGITESSLYRRIWKNHIGSHAGSSTLRLTLGCLFGYTLIPRDKKTPNNGHVRFCSDDERALRCWMKENLVFHFLPNDNPKSLETELIARFNPPLNLSENENPVNSDFRATVSALRGQKPWQSI